MRLIKRTRVHLITLGLLVFTAGLAQAGGFIEEWVARYDGSADGGDLPTAIAVDSSCNIYVTGVSDGSGTSGDYATIKYDSTGNELWVRRYNGPGNDWDAAGSIVVDGSGDIYVTGGSAGSDTGSDYATIKYDSAGTEIWVRRYDGPGNSSDVATAIEVDGSGNIYVTGKSIGSGTDLNYATIKYDSAGNEIWVRRYDVRSDPYCANILAVDNSSNVYVASTSYDSGTDNDYTIIKYDTNGNQLWVATYNGPGNGCDVASDISVDDSGNVYVTGISEDASCIYFDYATIKYDPNGVEQWVCRYNGPGGGDDYANAMAVDGFGNIYVTGWSWDPNTLHDYYTTIKYDSAGSELWVREYLGSAYDMAMDSSSNIYVTGYSYGSGTDDDYATIKYDSAGNQLWVATYNGPGNMWDEAYAIAVDDSGNIYVTGWSYSSGTREDYATIKYSQIRVILTMQTEPAEVNTVTPLPGTNLYAQGVTANISAQRFVDCPDVYVFDHWEGDVNDPNSANTTIIMDANETVTAVFVDGRQCGDECHPYPEGDFDKDCEVTFVDFALFAAHWLECTKPSCD